MNNTRKQYTARVQKVTAKAKVTDALHKRENSAVVLAGGSLACAFLKALNK